MSVLFLQQVVMPLIDQKIHVYRIKYIIVSLLLEHCDSKPYCLMVPAPDGAYESQRDK